MYSILFLGTPDFSTPFLKEFIKNPHFKIKGVLTKPNKKIGRKQIESAPPVKIEAEKNLIPVFQPHNKKEVTQIIKSKFPKIDLIFVVAYGQILSKKTLNIPKYGCINAHASLLPKYRGASPIQSSILNGDQETGISFILMEEGLDTGPIIKEVPMKLSNQETISTLHDNLAKIGAKNSPKTVIEWIKGDLIPQKQNDHLSSHCQQIEKNDGKVNWNQSATQIKRQFRAFHPWPGIFTFWNKKRFKLIKIKQSKTNKVNKPGVLSLEEDKVLIQTKKGSIELNEVQIEGKKITSIQEFIKGHPSIIGSKFSN